MDRLILLSRAFHSHQLSALEYRRAVIDTVGTMHVDEVMSLAWFFSDADMDDEECELTN